MPVNLLQSKGSVAKKKFGFVVGGVVTVVSEINGSLIVNVKESRVAIGKDMASKIMV